MKAMFEAMNLKLTEKEVRDIFNSIDIDWSGKISYPEFIADFNKTVEKDIMSLINEEKERAEFERTGSQGYQSMGT
jgi:Ca2+-binding EF-hand superfamily protein